MKRLFAAIVLCVFPMLAWGNASIVVPDVCSGAPPVLAAGVSPDGAVCLGQSVRDSKGTVWKYVKTGTATGVVTGGKYPFQAAKFRISGGRAEFIFWTDWVYWDYVDEGFHPLGWVPPVRVSPPTDPVPTR